MLRIRDPGEAPGLQRFYIWTWLKVCLEADRIVVSRPVNNTVVHNNCSDVGLLFTLCKHGVNVCIIWKFMLPSLESSVVFYNYTQSQLPYSFPCCLSGYERKDTPAENQPRIKKKKPQTWKPVEENVFLNPGNVFISYLTGSGGKITALPCRVHTRSLYGQPFVFCNHRSSGCIGLLGSYQLCRAGLPYQQLCRI